MDAFQKEIRGSKKKKKGVCGLYFKRLVRKEFVSV